MKPGDLPPPYPAEDVLTVTMLAPFFHRFRAWARSQGFLVATLPDGDSDRYIVVPADTPPGATTRNLYDLLAQPGDPETLR